MHIGLDFDNTIVCYDKLFHRLALDENLIPANTPVDKLAVREYLRKTNQESKWTTLQGEAYGKHMDQAEAYPDVLSFITCMKEKNHRLTIVSHKTKHPYLGHSYDLHTAAFQWIATHLVFNHQALFNEDHIFFELTKEAKLERIAKINCDIYIDDLPEILLAEHFPQHIKGILFDPQKNHSSDHQPINIFHSWIECEQQLS